MKLKQLLEVKLKENEHWRQKHNEIEYELESKNELENDFVKVKNLLLEKLKEVDEWKEKYLKVEIEIKGKKTQNTLLDELKIRDASLVI